MLDTLNLLAWLILVIIPIAGIAGTVAVWRHNRD